MFETILIIGSLYFNYRAPLENKIDPRCFDEEYVRVWVYFTDKGIETNDINKALSITTKNLSPNSIARRKLRNGTVDFADIPVKEDYLEAIQQMGAFLLHRSKWLNAASFLIHRENLENIARFDFVYKIVRVAQSSRVGDLEKIVQDSSGIYTNHQLQMFKIDSLHSIGVFGSNIKVGFLDTGLRRHHVALDSIKVIAEYDFLGGDQILLNGNAVTYRRGLYTELLFHKSDNRLELFLIGDTNYVYMPSRDILYTYSLDNGYTWSELKKLTFNPNNNWTAEMDICGDDTTFVFYHDRFGLNYLAMDTSIIAGPFLMSGGNYSNPKAVQDGDTVYFFYRDKTNIFMRKITMNGYSEQTLIVSNPANIKLSNVFAGVSKIGLFYSRIIDDSLFFAWSSAPFDTFYPKFSGLMAKDPAVACLGDTIFAIFKDASNPPFLRIGFIRSDDFGTTFSSPSYITGLLNSIGRTSISHHGNTITATWESNGKIYRSVSYDNGAHFSTLDSLDQEFVYLPTLGNINSQAELFYCQRGDNNTDGYLSGDPDFFHPRHGTEMLGLVGGYAANNYTGVAPGAQFIVAKTENPDSLYEFPSEEDTYIAGLEWAESKGADIISSSLGYTDWYNWPYDYDGKSSPASIAVYEATKRGLIVVTAAGNVAIPQLVIPGDAIDVITVGGIDSTFQRWQYSGRGPTYDGRLKPEIVCLSAAPVVINPDEKNSYLYSFGTSGATAITAGICALLLEGHHRWNVDSVRTALFKTASSAESPNDSTGYGWPDVVKAFYYTEPEIQPEKGCRFLDPFPNPFTVSIHNNIYLPFILNTKTYVELRIFSITGRLIKKIETNIPLTPGRYSDTDPNSLNAAFNWDGRDDTGNYVGSGIYYCLLYTYGAGNDVTKIVIVR